MLVLTTKFRTLSFLKFKVFFSLFLIGLFLTSCGGGGNSGKSKELKSISEYTISFFDDNLDVINSTKRENNINVNITAVADEFGIVSAFAANSSDNVVNNPIYENYNLTQNVNFYTISGVIEIKNQEELNAIRYNLNGKYILVNDIALDENGAGFEDENGWLPIDSFKGIFNGNNHKITNLWIDRQSKTETDFHVGFFSKIYNAQIKNLGIETAIDKEIKGYAYIGGITAYASSSSIINSYFTGNISSDEGGGAGGITGIILSDSSIINSYSIGNINAGRTVGGIVGIAFYDTIINNTYFIGNVSSNAKGYGNHEVGGIAGEVFGDSSVSNSYFIGNVKNVYSDAGGIVGMFYGSNVVNNVAMGSIVGFQRANRIIGYFNSGSASNNFGLDTMLINEAVYSGAEDDSNGISKSIEELKTRSTYETDLGWGFEGSDASPWKIDPDKNDGLPYFYWQN
jgi:hypothetical protein